ncbi:hypothetical protein IV498_09155 [Paenarthrobacter sp. Z7-10]|nr:hypothetical protein [Paenarthrobacter sp. Z7-10]
MQRMVRRETLSSRAILAGVAALLVTLLAIYALLESTLRAIGQPAWLVDPLTAVQRASNLPDGVSRPLLGVIGVVLALLGLMFFVTSVLPGKRAKHVLSDPRLAVVVDDEVIAAALARTARLAAGVTPEQVMVIVSRREAVVNIRPTSGVAVPEAAVLAAVEQEIRQMALTPRPAVHVNVGRTGVIGV